jgi:hypothetical protein
MTDLPNTLSAAQNEIIRLRKEADALVAAAYEDAEDLLSFADQEQAGDGVMWGDMAQIADAISSRTPAKARAALDAKLAQSREEGARAMRDAIGQAMLNGIGPDEGDDNEIVLLIRKVILNVFAIDPAEVVRKD